jgi:DNA-binding transcriptional regulator GbsR (MarR family)
LSTDKQAADAVITAIAKAVRKYNEGPSEADLEVAKKIAKLIMQKEYQQAERMLTRLAQKTFSGEVFRYLKKKGA